MRNKLFAKFLSLILILSACLSFSGCANNSKKDTIKLSVWVSADLIDLTKSMLDEYAASHSDSNYEFVVSEQSESSCATVIKADIENTADLFVFADDQLDELISLGVLRPIGKNTNAIISSFGGVDSNAAEASMRNGMLYAYPRNAGNGYFLYYNKAYLSESDVSSLSTLLRKCESFDKKFAMEITSGWYLYSFFKAAGLDITIDENGTACNWNSTNQKYSGVDVFKAICNYTSSSAFLCATNESLMEEINNGTIIAAVNGPWNASFIKSIWDENYAATKLPTYRINGKDGEDLQMCSFSGYKLIGVNSNSAHPVDAADVAEFLTNEENQLRIYEKTGELPANVKASNNQKVTLSPVASALLKQSEYSFLQRVPSTFWTASRILGTFVGSANLDKFDEQTLLDDFMNRLMED